MVRWCEGGFLWFAVFNRSVLVLLLGTLTLIGYLGLNAEHTYNNGPMYALAPLPVLIYYYWVYCEEHFRLQCQDLSMQDATEVIGREGRGGEERVCLCVLLPPSHC